MLQSKKLARKFAVLNNKENNRRFILPMDKHSLNYIQSLHGDTSQINFDADIFDYSNGDYMESDKVNPFVRMSKFPSNIGAFKRARLMFPKKESYSSNSTKSFIKLNDATIKVTNSFFNLLTQGYGLKYVMQGNSHYDSDNIRTIYVDDSLVPENLTESMQRVGRLVSKDNLDEIFGTETLLQYHYSDWHPKVSEQFMKYMDKNSGAVNFGFEAEKMDYNFRDKDNAIKLAFETGFKKERDGSLGDGGFELISPVLPLFNDAVISEVINPIKDMLNADTTDRCGGHFNVSKVGVHSREIIKKIKGSLPIFYSIYSKRLDNSYCRAYNFSTYLRSPKKYQAFYLKNESILEFRIFPAIKNETILNNRINLMRIIFNDLYGKTHNAVILEMAKSTTALHKFMFNVVCGGNVDKFRKKVQEFASKSVQYKCGAVTPHTKKKVNKLMNFDVFQVQVPIATTYTTATDTTTFVTIATASSNISDAQVLASNCEEVRDMYENALATDNFSINDIDIISPTDEWFNIPSNESVNTMCRNAFMGMSIVPRHGDIRSSVVSIGDNVGITAWNSIENINMSDSNAIMWTNREDRHHVANRVNGMRDYSHLCLQSYMKMFLINMIAIRYNSFENGEYSMNFKYANNSGDHYVKMSSRRCHDGSIYVQGSFAKSGDGRRYTIGCNLNNGKFIISKAV